MFRFISVPSLNFLLKRRFPLLIITTDFSVCMEMCAWVLAVLDDVRRWVKHFKDANTSIQDQPHSGRPQTASSEPNKKTVDEIIKEDRQVILGAIARKLGIGRNAVQEMIESLGYR